MFETEFSFVQDSASSGNRLFAVNGDVIYAVYEDHTLPSPYNIRDDLDVTAEAVIGELPLQVTDAENMPKSIVKSPKKTNQVTEFLPQNVICKEDLKLVYKATNGNPVCVNYDTAEILIQRGWS